MIFTREQMFTVVDGACDRFGGSITSARRSSKRNWSVGGHQYSYHLQGLAYDVVLDSRDDIDNFVEYLESFGLKVIDEGDHLHIQPLLNQR